MNRKRIFHIILAVGIALAFGSCASHKGSEKAQRPADYHIQVKNLSKMQKMIVDEAMDWMGTPYAYGNSDKGHGTDCSGMVLAVYRDVAGVMLPRNSAQQADFSQSIKKKDVKTGDLVFFATGKNPDRVSHVGIMLDEDRFIHASTSKGVVISSVSSPYYVRTFKKYGRIID